nr:MAG TPA: hypothetical protein [Siphoviridae sp. ctXG577]
MKAHIRNDEPSLSLSGNGFIFCGDSLFARRQTRSRPS